MYDIPPGKAFIPFHVFINAQKVGMPFFLAYLIFNYENYSPAMMAYTMMHGTYGLVWFLKHLTMPDPSFDRHCTIVCGLISWAAVLGPYLVPSYLIATRIAPQDPSWSRIMVSVICYSFGQVLVMASDA